MGERWIAEAEDLKTGSHPGTMEGGQPKVTWHVTVSPSGGGFFDAMRRVLVDKASEPHLLYDPVTDRLGQFFALDTSARALANDGSRRTNGSGSINIQIEVVAMADDFTRYWKPGPNFRAMMRAIRSWGIPDEWPGGYPWKQPSRSWTNYVKAGHFGHVHVPGNDHIDPQVKDGSLLFKAAQEDDDMQLTDKITVGKADGTGDEVITIATLFNRLQWGYAETYRQKATLDKLIANDAAQSAAIKALADAQGADAAAITAAVIAKINSSTLTITPAK